MGGKWFGGRARRLGRIERGRRLRGREEKGSRGEGREEVEIEREGKEGERSKVYGI